MAEAKKLKANSIAANCDSDKETDEPEEPLEERTPTPIDWKPQKNCYFCVDGKLITVNERGDLVPESGPVPVEPESVKSVSSLTSFAIFYLSLSLWIHCCIASLPISTTLFILAEIIRKEIPKRRRIEQRLQLRFRIDKHSTSEENQSIVCQQASGVRISQVIAIGPTKYDIIRNGGTTGINGIVESTQKLFRWVE